MKALTCTVSLLFCFGCEQVPLIAPTPTNEYRVIAQRQNEYIKLQHDGKIIVAHCTSVTRGNANFNECNLPSVGQTILMERWNQELAWQMNRGVQNFFIDSEN